MVLWQRIGLCLCLAVVAWWAFAKAVEVGQASEIHWRHPAESNPARYRTVRGGEVYFVAFIYGLTGVFALGLIRYVLRHGDRFEVDKGEDRPNL